MRKVIIERATRAITHVDSDIAPEGDYDVVEIADAEAAKIGLGRARYSLSLDNKVVAAAVADSAEETADAATLQTIKTLAQSAVGVRLDALTQVQVRALIAVLIYRAGGVNVADVTVRPLAEWV